MNIPEDLKYTEQHEWVRVEENRATIGITDFAQKELGDIVYVEAPEVDGEIEKSDAIGVVESTKAVSDIYAPVSGTIVEINEELEDAPETINEDPYERGWICVVELSDPSELEGLMDAKEYEKLLKEK